MTTQTTDTYAGLTIEITDDINGMADWVIGPDDDGSVDLGATCAAYADGMRAALVAMFPGVDVVHRFTNGGGRTFVSGHMDGDTWIEDDELRAAIDSAIDAVCPGGDPSPISMTRRKAT